MLLCHFWDVPCVCTVLHLVYPLTGLSLPLEHILTPKRKRNVRFTLLSVYSKWMSYFIQLLCFNNIDHLAMLCTKQKTIRWPSASIKRPQAPVPKFRKSLNQHIVCPPFSLTFAEPSQYIPVSLNGHTVELFWVPDVFLAVMTAGINLPSKSNVTKRRSWPCIVTRKRYQVDQFGHQRQ